MSLTPEQVESVVSELKRFGADLNLSDDQKQRVKTFMYATGSREGSYQGSVSQSASS